MHAKMEIVLFTVLVLGVCLQTSLARSRDDLLNTCIDADDHKVTPEPEPSLHGQCAPWRSRACCEDNSTLAFHENDVWAHFTWNHCAGHNLSDTCRQWFLKELCFYECSPNTGPWIQEHKIRIRNERYLNVPMCQSDCDQWWDACKDEYTCLGNWGKGFNYTTGVNTCPVGTTCQPFTVMFGNSTNFCTKIWDNNWRVVPDSEQCMRISLNNTGDNPNDAVARYYANINSASRIHMSTLLFRVFLSVIVILLRLLFV